MGHPHAHDHHDHQHSPAQFNQAFLIAIIANGLFVVIQIIYASIAHSTSLLADAIHNLGDVLSLILAWVAHGLLKRSPTENTTYGMKKTSILAALTNGLLLVFSCGVIVTEAIYKFFSPSEIQALAVMIVGGVGIIVNGVTAALFIRGKDDLNIRGAYLHLFYDALISAGVVVAAGIIYWTQWIWIDPLLGLVIAVIILKGTWFLFADSFRLIIDGVPRQISWTAVQALFLAQQGVKQVHDLHIWALSTQENALSVHLLMPDYSLSDEARQRLIQVLKEQYNVHHATIQVEKDLSYCEDACVKIL